MSSDLDLPPGRLHRCAGKPSTDGACTPCALPEDLATPGREAGGGQAQVLQRLGEEFRAELPATMAAIEQALAARQWADLRSRVHAIKGVAGSVGFPQLTRLAQPVEASIVNGRHEEAELQCAQLLTAAREILELDA
jgi:HPt (histidine-containing phosphotransfer) domain-containing protein